MPLSFLSKGNITLLKLKCDLVPNHSCQTNCDAPERRVNEALRRRKSSWTWLLSWQSRAPQTWGAAPGIQREGKHWHSHCSQDLTDIWIAMPSSHIKEGDGFLPNELTPTALLLVLTAQKRTCIHPILSQVVWFHRKLHYPPLHTPVSGIVAASVWLKEAQVSPRAQ